MADADPEKNWLPTKTGVAWSGMCRTCSWTYIEFLSRSKIKPDSVKMHTSLLKFNVEDEQQHVGSGLLLGALKLGQAQTGSLYNQVSLPALSDGIQSCPTVTN
jgi:hypothetical protein